MNLPIKNQYKLEQYFPDPNMMHKTVKYKASSLIIPKINGLLYTNLDIMSCTIYKYTYDIISLQLQLNFNL